MTPEAVRQRLAEIAAQQLGWQRPLPEGSLAASLDSMERLALVVAIEDGFGIAFTPEDDATVDTVDDLVACILERAAEG
jgi:acyl carrier protein